MNMQALQGLIDAQRAYFQAGNTLSAESRIAQLQDLRSALLSYEPRIYEALQKDLGKSRTEAYMCELGMVLSELSYMVSHVKKLSKPRRAPTPLSQFAAGSFQLPCPL